MKTVVITGANGALGRKLYEIITWTADFWKAKVVLTDFKIDNKEEIKRLHNTEETVLEKTVFVEGDITLKSTIEAISKEFKDSKPNDGSAIINCAACLKLSEEIDKIEKVNVDLPLTLQHIAKENKARFIQVSSCSIYEPKKGSIAENDELLPTSNYEYSKAQADKELLFYENGETTIVRPGLIYGPGTRHLGSLLATIPVLLKRVGVSYIPKITRGPRTNWIHVTDLAASIIKILSKDNLKHKIYNIVETEPQHFGDTFSLVCRLSEVDPVGFGVPIPPAILFKYLINKIIKRNFIFDLTNGFIDLWWSFTDVSQTSGLKPFLEKEMCTYLEGDMIFSNARARREELLSERFNHRRGWENSLAWYRRNNWI